MKHVNVAKIMSIGVSAAVGAGILAVPAFADQPEMQIVTQTGSMVIGSGSGTAEQYAKHSYGAFKIMNKLCAYDDSGNPIYKDADGNPIYHYLIADAFKDFSDPNFEIDDKTGRIYVVNNPWTGEALPAKIALTSEDGSLDYTGNAMYVSALASSLQKYAKERGIGPTATFESGEVRNLTQGYYMVFDLHGGEDDDDLTATLPILCNVDAEGVRLTVKDSKVTLDKTIVDANGGVIGDEDDYNVGDEVFFEITGAIPVYPANVDMDNLKFDFTDTLIGADFNEDHVFVGIRNPVAEGQTGDELIELVQKTEDSDEWDYEVVLGEDADGNQTVLIHMNPATIVKYPGMGYVLRYSGFLNEDAVIEGSPAAKNKIELEYSNDPNMSDATKTIEDEVKLFTYGIDFRKVDDHGLLGGATFTLKSLADAEDDGTAVALILDTEKSNDSMEVYRPVKDGETGVTEFVTSGKEIRFYGLDSGTYSLTETEAPEGYAKLADPVVFSITALRNADGDFTGEAKVELLPDMENLCSLNTPLTGTTAGDTAVDLTIKNFEGISLPETGSMTSLFVMGAGAVIAAGGGLYLGLRKKNEIKE